METSAKEKRTVLEAEYGISSIKYACVPMAKHGMVLAVLSKNHVVAESSGMTPVCNVTVLMVSTGMVEHVFSVQMVRFGMQFQEAAFVKQEVNGMDSSVLLFNNVSEAQCGIKIHGLVNALLRLSGITNSVLLIHVKVAKSGII
jgi:hypothetical protein